MRISDWSSDVCSSDLGTAAAQDPVQDALKGCESELQTYCSEVTPGDGRLVSCAEAYEDKLSSQCIAAINRAGYWLTYLATTIDYIARQCEADAAKHCRSEEHTSELQSLMRISYAVFCLKKKKKDKQQQ